MDLEKLERLANANEPGPWYYRHGTSCDHWELWNEEHTFMVQDDSGVEPTTDFLEYISALDPTTVLKLIKVAKAAIYHEDMCCSFDCSGAPELSEAVSDLR